MWDLGFKAESDRVQITSENELFSRATNEFIETKV